MGDIRATKITTYGDTPVPPHRRTSKVCKDEGLEQPSTTARMMRKVDDNKVFITLVIAIIGYIASQLMLTRDSAQVQPYVDKLQDQRIEQNTTKLEKMDRKLDAILERLPK